MKRMFVLELYDIFFFLRAKRYGFILLSHHSNCCARSFNVDDIYEFKNKNIK